MTTSQGGSGTSEEDTLHQGGPRDADPEVGEWSGRMTRVSTCSRHRGETSGLARLGTMTRWEHDGPPEIRRAVVW
jgi:hypothetical protein